MNHETRAQAAGQILFMRPRLLRMPGATAVCVLAIRDVGMAKLDPSAAFLGWIAASPDPAIAELLSLCSARVAVGRIRFTQNWPERNWTVAESQ